MIWNWIGTALLCLTTVVVAQERKPPSITKPKTPSVQYVQGNSNVTLECVATGIPAVVYKWFLNNQDIPSSNNKITFSATTGVLQIRTITVNEEGYYHCEAKNTYQNQDVKVYSPKIEIRVARISAFPNSGDVPNYTFVQGQYAKVPCDPQLPVYYGPTNFKWYTPEGNNLIEFVPNARRFIDQEGNLHFSYIMPGDQNTAGNNYYQCAMTNSVADIIRLGSAKQVIVTPLSGSIQESKPGLEYKTPSSKLTVQRNSDAVLECVFGGFVNAAVTVPTIKWYHSVDTLITNGNKYKISNQGRTLTIKTVSEDDEVAYRCVGTNSEGSATGTFSLNVTSVPLWVEPLSYKTVPENQNAVFTCKARSAVNETAPGTPEWYKNGNRMGPETDTSKYSFSADKKTLTVISPQKATDIACFQCYVSNSEGESTSDGCLNVLYGISIIQQPSLDQVITKGDIVNLTVLATTDPLMTLSYKWVFNNVTYGLGESPPNVDFDSSTMAAKINTSNLTDAQYAQIGGVYRRVIFHLYETKYVDITVTLEDETIIAPAAAAGFDFWIIGLIIGLLILLIVIIIIICVICRRKMQEGQYPLGRKETDAGLDPEKDLKDSGFHDLSRADYDDYPEKGKQPPSNFDFEDLPFEDDDDFEGEYDRETQAFNEDGSFIGVYRQENKNKGPRPPPYSPEGPTESNV